MRVVVVSGPGRRFMRRLRSCWASRPAYDAITIEKIAAQAGVGMKQTIYPEWWPSKAAIIVDVWAEVIAPRVAFPDTGDLEADLRAQLTRMLDVLAEPVLGRNYMAVIADSQRDERRWRPKPVSPHRLCSAHCRHERPVAISRQQAMRPKMRDDIDVDSVTDLLYGGIFLSEPVPPSPARPRAARRARRSPGPGDRLTSLTPADPPRDETKRIVCRSETIRIVSPLQISAFEEMTSWTSTTRSYS